MVSDIRFARIGDTIESVRPIGGKHLRMACDTHGAVKHANVLLSAGTWRLVERSQPSRDWLLRMAESEDAAGGIPSAGDITGDCDDCAEGLPLNCCTASKRACGHHCNHAWTHDICCWCGKTWDGS